MRNIAMAKDKVLSLKIGYIPPSSRQDIEVLPADEPKQLKLGWVVSEIIGIGIVNPRGVATGVMA